MVIENKYKAFWPRVGAGFLDSAVFAPLVWIDWAFWNATSSPVVLMFWFFIYQALNIGYVVGFTYYYGQTLGKMATGIVILDKSESPITFGQAIIRHIVPIILGFVSIGFVFNNLLAGNIANRGLGAFSNVLMVGFVAFGWLALEWVTMLFNSKRRAFHDFIAGTVVVRQSVEEKRKNSRTIMWVLIALLLINSFFSRYLTSIDSNLQFPIG